MQTEGPLARGFLHMTGVRSKRQPQKLRVCYSTLRPIVMSLVERLLAEKPTSTPVTRSAGVCGYNSRSRLTSNQ